MMAKKSLLNGEQLIRRDEVPPSLSLSLKSCDEFSVFDRSRERQFGVTRGDSGEYVQVKAYSKGSYVTEPKEHHEWIRANNEMKYSGIGNSIITITENIQG